MATGVSGGVELHGEPAVVVEFGEPLVNGREVDFAGAGFVPAGDVGDVDEADEVEVGFELFEQISEGPLLLVEVE